MRKYAAANRRLRSARQIPFTLCSRPFCWYFCWYRGSQRSWRISLFQHRKPARPMGRRVARKEEGGESQTRRIVAVRDPKTIEVLELRVGYVNSQRSEAFLRYLL